MNVTNAHTNLCVDGIDRVRMGSVILTAGQPFARDVEPQSEWFTVAASGGPVTVGNMHVEKRSFKG